MNSSVIAVDDYGVAVDEDSDEVIVIDEEVDMEINNVEAAPDQLSEPRGPDIGGEMEGNSVEAAPEEVSEPMAPYVGQRFKTAEAALQLYTDLGTAVGFGVIIRDSGKYKDGSYAYAKFACSREGDPRRTAENPDDYRPSGKGGCKAYMSISFDKVKQDYRVTTVKAHHNHDMSPSKGKRFPSNKRMDTGLRRRLLLNDLSGVRPSKNFSSIVTEVGGYDNMTFTEKDARNYIHAERRAANGKSGVDVGDANAMLEYFTECAKIDKEFVYAIALGEDGRLHSVVWVDGKAKAAYESFGHVVSFDTTYKTNCYGMPFAPFVGINHHGCSILFGAALLGNESIASFEWMMTTWLSLIGGKAPLGIITDQDKAMRRAIETVFPGVRHRWCIFHITRKIPEKLGSLRCFSEVRDAFESVIWQSWTPEEFDTNWQNLIKNYSLEKIQWLSDLWEGREFWAPIYQRDFFWAHMSSTQRSESINSFFDGYVNSGTNLKRFVVQYHKAVGKLAENEIAMDFKSTTSEPANASPYPFERPFHTAYSHGKYSEIKTQLRETMGMEVVRVGDVIASGEGDGIRRYKVVDVYGNSKRGTGAEFFVTSEGPTHFVRCSCMLFEFDGIVCSHAFQVLAHEHADAVDPRLVLDRWRRNVKWKHSRIRTLYIAPELDDEAEEYAELHRGLDRAYDATRRHSERVKMLRKSVEEITEKLLKMEDFSASNKLGTGGISKSKKGKVAATSPPEFADASAANVLDPKKGKTKGRPPGRRTKSTAEIEMRKNRKPRKRKGTVDHAANEASNLTDPGSSHDVGVNNSSNQALGGNNLNYMAAAGQSNGFIPGYIPLFPSPIRPNISSPGALMVGYSPNGGTLSPSLSGLLSAQEYIAASKPSCSTDASNVNGIRRCLRL